MLALTLRSQTSELRRMADALHGFAEQNRLSPGEESALQLVLEELVSNVISHGHVDAETGEVSVQVDADARHLRIAVEDDGVPFDPTRAPTVPDTPLAERPIGGVGLQLIHSFARDLSYRREGERNQVSLAIDRDST